MFGLITFVWHGVMHPSEMLAALQQHDERHVRQLTWRLLEVTVVMILINAVVMELARHYHYLPVEHHLSESATNLRNTPLKRILLSWSAPSVLLVAGYPLTRWIWFFVFRFHEQRLAVLASIALTVAYTLALFLPQTWLDATVGQMNDGRYRYWLATFYSIAGVGIMSYYYKVGVNLPFWKAVLFNVGATLMFLVGSTIVITVGAVLWAMVTVR
jgi:cation transport ATPase